MKSHPGSSSSLKNVPLPIQPGTPQALVKNRPIQTGLGLLAEDKYQVSVNLRFFFQHSEYPRGTVQREEDKEEKKAYMGTQSRI